MLQLSGLSIATDTPTSSNGTVPVSPPPASAIFGNTSVPQSSTATMGNLPFSVEQLGSFQIALRLSACLSVVGCLAIISTYISHQRYRTAANRLIFYTSFSELGLALMALIGDASVRSGMASSGLCTFQGLVVHFSGSSMMWWSLCMALHCLLIVLHKKPVNALDNMFILYCILSWGVPLISTFLILSLGNDLQKGPSISDNFIFCWIASPYKEWRLYSYYIPLWIIFFINLTMYCIVVRELKKMKASALALRYMTLKPPPLNPDRISHQKLKDDKKAARIAEKIEHGVSVFVLRTYMYVAMFTVNWFVPSVNRMWGIVSPGNPNYVLFLFHSFSAPSGGFLDAIVYFYFSLTAEQHELVDDDDNTTSDSQIAMDNEAVSPIEPTRIETISTISRSDGIYMISKQSSLESMLLPSQTMTLSDSVGHLNSLQSKQESLGSLCPMSILVVTPPSLNVTPVPVDSSDSRSRTTSNFGVLKVY